MTPSCWQGDKAPSSNDEVHALFLASKDQPDSPAVTIKGWKSEEGYYRVPVSKSKLARDYQKFEVVECSEEDVFLMPRQCLKLKDVVDDQLYHLHEKKVKLSKNDLKAGMIGSALDVKY